MILHIINTVVFLVLALIWSRDRWPNFFLKLLFATLFVANLIKTLKVFGLIVKIQ